MKLTDIVKNPSALKSSSKSSFCYTINAGGKNTTVNSHVEAITVLLSNLASAKLISITDIEDKERMAGFPLVIEVTDLKSSEDIVTMLTKVNANWKNRYQTKKLLEVGSEKYIVCREWTSERVDKFINKILTPINANIKEPTKTWSVKRINNDIPAPTVTTPAKPIVNSSKKV